MNYRTTRTSSTGRVASILLALVLAMGAFGANTPYAYAGFGITPPYVKNDRLTRGTTFEQHITLVRSDPVDDLKVQITMNLPGVESWFSVDKGTEFIMPAGVSQMPIVVSVHVPQDATYESHRGAIRIRTSSASASSSGAVSIALGAQVDVAITVVDKIFDFDVRRIRVADLEEGYRKWSLYFPGKIRFFMTIENTGNTEFGPTKVRMDIYDADSEQLLETTEHTNRIETIAPFGTKEVIAELPTRLPAGRYVAKYTIFKQSDVAQQDQIALSISPLGGVPGYTGYGLEGLSLTDKLKVGVVLLVPVLFLIFVFAALVARRRRAKTYGGSAR